MIKSLAVAENEASLSELLVHENCTSHLSSCSCIFLAYHIIYILQSAGFDKYNKQNIAPRHDSPDDCVGSKIL